MSIYLYLKLVNVDWVLLDLVSSDWVSDAILRLQRVQPIHKESIRHEVEGVWGLGE